MIKKINNNVTSIDLDKYVNAETGETLLSEAKDSKIQVKGESNECVIDSKEYIIIDSAAYRFICKLLGKADVSRVVAMGDMVKTPLNILHTGNNKPHTAETLAKDLGVSPSEFIKMISRLYHANVIIYVTCYKSGYNEVMYILNPTLARKRRVFDTELFKNFFQDLSTKAGQEAVLKAPKRKRGRQPASKSILGSPL